MHKLPSMDCICGETRACMHPQIYTIHPHEECSSVHIVLHIIRLRTWANTAWWAELSFPPEVEQITVGDTPGYLHARKPLSVFLTDFHNCFCHTNQHTHTHSQSRRWKWEGAMSMPAELCEWESDEREANLLNWQKPSGFFIWFSMKGLNPSKLLAILTMCKETVTFQQSWK